MIFLGAITLFAVLLRGGVSGQLLENYSQVQFPSPDSDMYDYRRRAKAVVDGSYDYEKGFFKQPFFYMCYLPVVFALGGESPLALVVVQLFLSGLTIFLTGLCFARLFGRPVGLMAALILALSRMHVFYTPFPLIALLQSFWMILLFYLVIQLYKKTSFKNCVLCALVLAAANLTRGNMVLLLPLVLVLLGYRLRVDKKQMLLKGILFVCVFVIPHLPFAWVNYQAYGQWKGTALNSVDVFAVGNSPESAATSIDPYVGEGFMPFESSYSYMEWTEEANRRDDRRIGVMKNIWNWATSEPLAFLELKWRMFLLYWNKVEIPNNVAISRLKGKEEVLVEASLIHMPFLIDFSVIGSLGVMGLLLSLRRRRVLVCFAFCAVMVYALSIVMCYVLARFRLPMLPLLAGFSAYGLHLLWRALRYRALPQVSALSFGFVCFISVVLVCLGYGSYRNYWESTVLSFVRPSGVALELNDKVVIKDNGPDILGGWTPQRVENKTYGKKFLKPEFLLEGENVVLRWRMMNDSKVPENFELSLQSNVTGDTTKTITVKPGWHWYSIDCGPCQSMEMPIFKFYLTVSGYEGRASYFIFDDQRNYGRSLLSEKPMAGEWVMEFVLNQ